VPDKQTGKKHGKGTLKAGDGFASVAYDSHRKQLKRIPIILKHSLHA
jgi:hypothetical protein